MNKKKSATVLGLLTVCIVISSCSRNGSAANQLAKLPNDVVLEWNEIAYKAFDGPEYLHSLMAARINAMVHLAMHDALNAIYPVYATYRFKGKDEHADPTAAAASAAHTVLMNEIPLRKNYLDSALRRSLVSIPEGEAKKRGMDLGKLAGEEIIAARAGDGSAGEVMGKIPLSIMAGVYQAVPPFDFVFAPHWENVKLFSLKTKDQFRCVPPPAMTSAIYTADFNEVKQTGGLKSTTRTAEQSSYAKFWYEFSEAGWSRITRVVARDKNLNLFETARLFALVEMAIADAYTAGWDSKLHYNFWRPYTAIRRAANDGNSATAPDPAWEPAEATPPVQDYPSTHSALGNAAATVLASILGDETVFTTISFTAVPFGTSRSFSSFSKAADENADSRVMAGIHFRFSCIAGQDLGNKIGKWTVERHLLPLQQGN